MTSWARRWATTHAGEATTTALAVAVDHAGALRFDASGRSAPHGYTVVNPSPSGRHGGDGQREGGAPRARTGRSSDLERRRPAVPAAGAVARVEQAHRRRRLVAEARTAPAVPSRSTITSVAADAYTHSRPSAPTGTTARLATVSPVP